MSGKAKRRTRKQKVAAGKKRETIEPISTIKCGPPEPEWDGTSPMPPHHLRDFYFDTLHFCACGSPIAAMRYLGDVLAMIKARSEHPDRTHEDWKEYQEKIDAKMCADREPGLGWIVLYLLDSYGLTEHGLNIRGGWLTPKGNALVDAINRYDLDKVFDCKVVAGGEAEVADA